MLVYKNVKIEVLFGYALTDEFLGRPQKMFRGDYGNAINSAKAYIDSFVTIA